MENILYLIHTTNKNPKDYDSLIPANDIDNQFPGVYLTLITKDNIDVEQLYPGKYIMIFSKSLLEQKNYHINIQDYNGIINEKNTFYPWNLKKAVQKIKQYSKNEESIKMNEVVFHDPISFKYLCKIIVKPSANNNLNEFLKFKLPREECISKEKPDLKLLPFYVYPFENMYTGINPLPKSSLEFYIKMAKLAKLNPIPKTKEDICIELKKKLNYFLKNRNQQNINSLK